MARRKDTETLDEVGLQRKGVRYGIRFLYLHVPLLNLLAGVFVYGKNIWLGVSAIWLGLRRLALMLSSTRNPTQP
jgi:hypothetical protein